MEQYQSDFLKVRGEGRITIPEYFSLPSKYPSINAFWNNIVLEHQAPVKRVYQAVFFRRDCLNFICNLLDSKFTAAIVPARNGLTSAKSELFVELLLFELSNDGFVGLGVDDVDTELFVSILMRGR